MIKQEVTVTNKVGLHARPAALLVQTAQNFKSTIIIKNGDRTADAKSILSVIGLGVMPGTTITLLADGEDAQEAVDALARLVKEDFRKR